MVQLKAIHRKPRSNVLGRDLNQAWCFEHCFWEHQRKLFSGRGYDPRDQDAVSRPMGSLIEKPFNLSMKKMLIRFRNLTPARMCWWKVTASITFLAWGDQTKTVGRLNLYGSAVTEEKWESGGSFDDRINRLCYTNGGEGFVWILRSRAGREELRVL